MSTKIFISLELMCTHAPCSSTSQRLFLFFTTKALSCSSKAVQKFSSRSVQARRLCLLLSFKDFYENDHKIANTTSLTTLSFLLLLSFSFLSYYLFCIIFLRFTFFFLLLTFVFCLFYGISSKNESRM